MAKQTIEINRAPVLTLWGAVVAERMGFNWDEALTLGRALAGLTAQSKGRRLGIFKPSEEGAKKAREKKHGEEFFVQLLGRRIPAKNTEDGVRAVSKDKVQTADSAQSYLEKKFGDQLDAARKAMEKLAKAYDPDDLEEAGFGLYEDFRPDIPGGKRGWGAKGTLDLSAIPKLAKKR